MLSYSNVEPTNEVSEDLPLLTNEIILAADDLISASSSVKKVNPASSNLNHGPNHIFIYLIKSNR